MQLRAPNWPGGPSSSTSAAARARGARPELSLFFVSVLALFVEMMVIRWLGGELPVLAYLQNAVLVTCFMGLAMGCLSSRRHPRLVLGLGALALLAAILSSEPTRAVLRTAEGRLAVFDSQIGWYVRSLAPLQRWITGTSGLMMVALVLTLVWVVFLPLGRWLGRCLDEHASPLRAYSINIGGSLAGIVGFLLLSWLETPPWCWALVAAAVALATLRFGGVTPSVPVVLSLVCLVSLPLGAALLARTEVVRWSPYQKISVVSIPPGSRSFDTHSVKVNTLATYMRIIDLSTPSVEPAWNPHPELRGLSQYDLPLVLHGEADSVLVLGAGAGNDVAAALRAGARRVVAVEIDPTIADIGRRLHPERPYDSPSVELVIDDARAVLARDRSQYDVVVFGLLDSHTAGLGTTRIDDYVYTRESLALARRRLASGGVLVLSFQVNRPFIASRIANTLRALDGRRPWAVRIPSGPYGPGGTLFAVGDRDRIRRALAAPRLEAAVSRWQQAAPLAFDRTVAPTTDDWPFFYLDRPRIPMVFAAIAAILAALFLATGGVRLLANLDGGWRREDTHFLLLGLAFLLLETVSINRAALALGSTWTTNAAVIGTMLCLILAANWIVGRARSPSAGALVWAGLCASIVAVAALDVSKLGVLAGWIRLPAVGIATTLPALFSGLVFARSFVSTADRDRALGMNLLGSLAGGVLQWAALWTGTRALLLIVLVAYLAALATAGRPATRPQLQ